MLRRYNMTPWVLALNEAALDLARLLPTTDTRLRADIRALELGQYDKAGPSAELFSRHQNVQLARSLCGNCSPWVLRTPPPHAMHCSSRVLHEWSGKNRTARDLSPASSGPSHILRNVNLDRIFCAPLQAQEQHAQITERHAAQLKQNGAAHRPAWFERVPGSTKMGQEFLFRYKGGYWEARAAGTFAKPAAE